MDLCESYFSYAGVSSEKYDLIFANVDTSEEFSLYGELDLFNIYNKKNSINYFTGFDTEDSALSFDAEVVTCDGSPIDKKALKEVEKWLFCRNDYAKLYCINKVSERFDVSGRVLRSNTGAEAGIAIVGKAIVGTSSKYITYGYVKDIYVKNGRIDGDVIVRNNIFMRADSLNNLARGYYYYDDPTKRLMFMGEDVPTGYTVTLSYSTYQDGYDPDSPANTYINCMFINPKKIESPAGIVGFQFTVVCDSLMAWQDETIQTRTLSSSTPNFDIYVDSDFMDYIYPEVTITMGSRGGDITLVNNSDNSSRYTKFVGIPANSRFVMNGNTNVITNNMYGRFSEKNFIRLVDGTNTFTHIGDIASISFSFNNRKFL